VTVDSSMAKVCDYLIETTKSLLFKPFDCKMECRLVILFNSIESI